MSDAPDRSRMPSDDDVATPSTGHPAISVVVATRGRPDQLKVCVDSVLACHHESFELVVVDQSEQPATLPDDPRIVYIHTSTTGKSAGLNLGLAAAQGTVLAFTDDDCTVPEDWLATAEELLARRPDVDMLFGDLRPIEHDPSSVFVPPASMGSFHLVTNPLSASVRGGAGADMVARRALFDVIGPYDEMIGPGSRFAACEEYDVYYRALVAGASVAFTPELVTIHWGARPYADGSGQTLLRSYAYGEGAVIGKHLRIGDLRMLVVLARITGQDLAVIAQSLRHRRLSGIGMLAYKWKGVAAGFVTRVDRRRRLFAT